MIDSDGGPRALLSRPVVTLARSGRLVPIRFSGRVVGSLSVLGVRSPIRTLVTWASVLGLLPLWSLPVGGLTLVLELVAATTRALTRLLGVVLLRARPLVTPLWHRALLLGRTLDRVLGLGLLGLTLVSWTPGVGLVLRALGSRLVPWALGLWLLAGRLWLSLALLLTLSLTPLLVSPLLALLSRRMTTASLATVLPR